MWNSIASDLKDFVSTVTEDTAAVAEKVKNIGKDEIDDGDKDSEKFKIDLLKRETDLRRSFDTYAVAPPRKRFAEFLSSFSDTETSVTEAKTTMLDEEPDVSRHYVELVPHVMSPSTFWARYFYKLSELHRGAEQSQAPDFIGRFDELEEDEEDIEWDDGVEAEQDSAGSGYRAGRDADKALISELVQSNDLLKKQVRTLISRITELESQLKLAQAQPATAPSDRCALRKQEQEQEQEQKQKQEQKQEQEQQDDGERDDGERDDAVQNVTSNVHSASEPAAKNAPIQVIALTERDLDLLEGDNSDGEDGWD